MKGLRPIEVERCCVCGEEYDKIRMHKIFTGRVKYICQSCHAQGHREIDAKRSTWVESARGKRVISESEKYK